MSARARTRHQWLLALLRRWFSDFEENPHTQIRFHKVAIRFWLANFAIAIGVFFFAPGLWAQASICYLAMISIYANFATDYDALSASQASLHAVEARDATAAGDAPASAAELADVDAKIMRMLERFGITLDEEPPAASTPTGDRSGFFAPPIVGGYQGGAPASQVGTPPKTPSGAARPASGSS